MKMSIKIKKRCCIFLTVSIVTLMLMLVTQFSCASAHEKDVYGGVVVPELQVAYSTGYFHAEKFNNRWAIFDPLGNPFYYIGVQNIRIPQHDLGSDENGNDYGDNVRSKYALGQGPNDGFSNVNARWAYYTRTKLKNWGFTVPSIYSYTPIVTDLVAGDPNMGNLPSNKMPYVLTFNNSLSAFNAGAKAVGTPESRSSYAPLFSYMVDPYDPIFGTTVHSLAQSMIGFNDAYLIAIFQGEADELKGIDQSHGHLGFQVAIQNPIESYNGTRTYSDTKYYAKYALRDFLINRYATIEALNSAWGTSYATFDSDGGYGFGSGFMDENGSHLPGYSKTVVQVPGDAAHPAMYSDLSEFATQLVRLFYKTVYDEFKSTAPNYMQLSPNFGNPPDFYLNGMVDSNGNPLADIYDVTNPVNGSSIYQVTKRPQLGYIVPIASANDDSPVALKGTVDGINPILGTQRITNGTFDSDLSGWTALNWTFNNGSAVATAGNTDPLTQSLVAGYAGSTTMKLSLQISGRNAGNISVKLGNTTISFSGATTLSADGEYSAYVSAVATPIIINRTADFDGSIDNISMQDVTQAQVTCNSCNFWWSTATPICGGVTCTYWQPHTNMSYMKFSSIPYYMPPLNTTKYQYYFKTFGDIHNFTILPMNAGGNGKFLDFFNYVRPGDTFERMDGSLWENTLKTQEDRGQYYYDYLNNLASSDYNGEAYIIGVDHWAWTDNNWLRSKYFELQNYGLVTPNDNAYDDIEAKMATGIDAFGFNRGGELDDYGNYITKVTQANNLFYDDFIATLTGGSDVTSPSAPTGLGVI